MNDVNKKVYETALKEYDNFKTELCYNGVDAIFDASYEIEAKKNLLNILDITNEDLTLLKDTQCPLAELYDAWLNTSKYEDQELYNGLELMLQDMILEQDNAKEIGE